MLRGLEGAREDGRVVASRGALSAVVHVAVIAVGLFAASRVPRLQAVKMPGSASGTHLLLTYSTGGVASESQSAVKKAVVAAKLEVAKLEVPKALLPTKSLPVPMPTEAKSMPQAEQGAGAEGMSGLGDGDMTIALPMSSPHPKPDLSSLSPGQSGNVILNAVIDAHGAISELTVVQSLNASVDQQVMAMVRGWSFKPATKNGLPVVSEQEIVLHYERG